MIKELRLHWQQVIIIVMIVGTLLGGRYLYRQVLPFYFSQQTELSATNQDGSYDYEQQQGQFLGKPVSSLPFALLTSNQILGVSDAEVMDAEGSFTVEKHIEVDLTNQKLYAVENGVKIAEFYVSTGKWGRTPTGEFSIWVKYRYTKMSGGNKALGTYYYLPNVPFTMYFYNAEIPQSRGYGIHGAYWHSNFGEVMSHGCINMRIRDVEKLYYWADPDTGGESTVKATPDHPGTKIIIYGEAPRE